MSIFKYGTPQKVVNVSEISREEWLTYRRQGIGGSDAAVTVGLNPYKSLLTLYYDKKGLLPETQDNEQMRQGRDLEQYVADRWTEKTGKKCRKDNFMYRSSEYPFMLADIDRDVIGENAGLECKTTSVYNKSDFDSGEIPLPYYVQCMHYMAVKGYDRMYLAVLVLNKGFYDFVIERNDEEIQSLIQAEKSFWEEHILKNIPPNADGSESTADTLLKLYPYAKPGQDTLSLPEEQIRLERYLFLNRKIKQMQEEQRQIKNTLMQKMGEDGVAVSGAYQVTFKEQSTTRINRKKLQAEFPNAYAVCAENSNTRVMRIKELQKKEK